MTLALIGGLIGIILGSWRAKTAGGDRKDQLQYAAVYGIALALLGMIIAIALVRSV